MTLQMIAAASLLAGATVIASISLCTSEPLAGSSLAVIQGGSILGGHLTVESLHIKEYETVWVEEDLQITSFGPIRIDGRMIALDAVDLDRVDAPSIRLTSPLLIDVPGEILGGSGADDAQPNGGNGSAITLTAPLVLIDGLVKAGTGGRGGWASKGGQGGDALVFGYFQTRGSGPNHYTLVSGRGGNGGYPGGAGGDSGAAVATLTEETKTGYLDLEVQIQVILQSYSTGYGTSPAQGCGAGAAGGNGGNSESPDGSEGAEGEAGSAGSPAGVMGGTGGNSSPAVGGSGSKGVVGADCCPDSGGTGGKGGKGGDAKTGAGGKGGKGGAGYTTGDPGGRGGTGGNSASATGGSSGDGGPGGKKAGSGGSAGEPGDVVVGPRGAGGMGGSGSPPGSTGGAGSKGTSTQSSIGSPGAPGGPCPQVQ